MLGIFPTNPARVHEPVVGDYQKLVCLPPDSYPPAQVYWGETTSGGKLQPIDETERIMLDYEGMSTSSWSLATSVKTCAVFNASH